MNEWFLIGKIQSDVDFKFVINSTHDSIAVFFIRLIDKNEWIKILAYDEKADYCIKKLKKGDIVLIDGYLQNINHTVTVIVHHVYADLS